MVTLWKCMIQPKLDYCSQLWSPSDQESINSIESVQINFLSRVAGTAHLNHWERLNLLHLYSQERRRERYMVIFLCKITRITTLSLLTVTMAAGGGWLLPGHMSGQLLQL